MPIKKFLPWYIAISVLFVLVISLLNAKNDAAIFDETAHISAGYSYLTQYDMRLNPEHPPLLKSLAAFPLLFLNLNFDTTQKYWTEDVNGQWDAGHFFLYESGNDWDQILFWSRVPMIFLSIGFALFLFWWGKKWLGLTGGIAVFTLAMFDPNILGHNHFVTTDLGIALFLTMALYFFLEFLQKPSWKNVLVGGFFLALAHLAKFSSVLLLPLFAVALVVYPLFHAEAKKRLTLLASYIGKGTVLVVVSFLIVWGVYAAMFFNTPTEVLQRQIDFSFPAHDDRPLAQPVRTVINTLSHNAFTRPLGEYTLGVAMVFKRVAGGNSAYFMGTVSNQSFPLYFPTVFVIKETLPFLAFLLIAAGFSLIKLLGKFADVSKNRVNHFAHFVRHNTTSWVLSGFIALYAFLSITGNLNIGFRHLFPLLPFLYLLAARQWTILTKHANQTVARFAMITGLFLLALQPVIVVATYPYYMSYFNLFAGGPKEGYRHVTDSNADWGQDLNRLKKWVAEHDIHMLHVDYFGGGNIYKVLGSVTEVIPWWDSRRPIEPGWYAISVNASQGSIYDPNKKDDESYRWLRSYTPVAQVGTSIFVYFIEK